MPVSVPPNFASSLAKIRVTRGPVSDKPLPSPFTIAIDTREQLPFRFLNLKADAVHHRRPLVISTQRTTIPSGDYSIVGFEREIAIERKSHGDLVNTLGQGRERFERELERLSRLPFSAVVIEAEWSTILYSPPEYRELHPKTIFRSIISWQQKFTTIHWWTLPDRRHAEIATYRILEKWWREKDEGRKREMRKAKEMAK